MRLDAWGTSDKGRKRDSNQDSLLIRADLGLYIVADGMGGHSGGEVASRIAVETCEEVVSQSQGSGLLPRDLVNRCYEESSRRIYDHANSENSRLRGMGTTMVLCLLRNKTLYIGNVGDSRAYLSQGEFLWQLTEDHSLMNEQLRAGLIQESQLAHFNQKNVITRSVGYEREVTVDILERALKPGDRFLICSDGLSGLVSDARLAALLKDSQGQTSIDRCLKEALDNGGDDNVTVLILEAS